MDLILISPISGNEFTPSAWLCGLVAEHGASTEGWKLIEALMLAGF